MNGNITREQDFLKQNTFYLLLHQSPRSNALPNHLGIKSKKIPIDTNVYNSLSLKVIFRLINFFKSFNKKALIIIEYDGNFVPIFCLAFVNIFYLKRFKIYLDCHVNSYINLNFYSIKTFVKLSLVYFFKYLFRFKTIVHNKASLKVIKNSSYCPSPFPENKPDKNTTKNRKLDNDVLIISSMNKDEPIQEYIKVAADLKSSGYKVLITGDKEKLKFNLDKTSSFFSGFLNKSDYFDLLRESKIIVAMTSRKYNLLFAPREALLNHKVCIINESKENEEFYGNLCFYAKPDSSSIIKKIKDLLRNQASFNETLLLELISNINTDIENFKKCLHTK